MKLVNEPKNCIQILPGVPLKCVKLTMSRVCAWQKPAVSCSTGQREKRLLLTWPRWDLGRFAFVLCLEDSLRGMKTSSIPFRGARLCGEEMWHLGPTRSHVKAAWLMDGILRRSKQLGSSKQTQQPACEPQFSKKETQIWNSLIWFILWS